MEKYLLTIEFRYNKKVKNENEYLTKKITIGVYNEFNEACKIGNLELEKLENRFKLHVYPSGVKAKKERFSVNGGPFWSKKTLISNLAYLKTSFDFYFKITTLKYEHVNNVINEILN